MNTAAATLWMLITVTGNGQVSHSLGYPNKHLCEEARSLARYGETTEAYAAGEAQEQARETAITSQRDRIVAAWMHKHPCLTYKPKDETVSIPLDEVSGTVAEYEKTKHGYYCPVESGFYASDISGNSWSPNVGEWSDNVHGQSITRYATDVKTAECVVQSGSDAAESKQ